MKKGSTDALTASERAALDAFAARPDNAVDTSDAPEIQDWTGAERGRFFRPVKQQLTLLVDADLVAWFRSRTTDGAGYQTRINQALRDYMNRHRDRG